jgi:acyl dehydratase
MAAPQSSGRRVPRDRRSSAPTSGSTDAIPRLLASGARAGRIALRHSDPAAARAAGLDVVPAHGLLSMAFLARLLTDGRPLDGLASFHVRVTAMPPGRFGTDVHRDHAPTP